MIKEPKPSVFKRTADWLNETHNLNRLETGSNVFFVFVFIFYFYGFRTGFRFHLIDIQQIILDIIVIIVSSVMIIRAFAKQGFEDELISNVKIKNKEAEHETICDKVNRDELGEPLRSWNIAEIKSKMRDKKEQLSNYYKQKRSRLINTKKESRSNIKKLEKLDVKIAHFSNPDTEVKVKHHWVTESELLTSSYTSRSNKEIETNYNVVRDVTGTQSGMVFASVLLFSLIRFAVDPTVESLWELLVFLGFIIPFLIIRAVVSYIGARRRTSSNYVYAIDKKIRIIKSCNVWKAQKKESD